MFSGNKKTNSMALTFDLDATTCILWMKLKTSIYNFIPKNPWIYQILVVYTVKPCYFELRGTEKNTETVKYLRYQGYNT